MTENISHQDEYELLPGYQGVQDSEGDVRPLADYGLDSIPGDSEPDELYNPDIHRKRAAVLGKSILNPFIGFSPTELDNLLQAYLAFDYAAEEGGLHKNCRNKNKKKAHLEELNSARELGNALISDVFELEGDSEENKLILTSIRSAMRENRNRNLKLIELVQGVDKPTPVTKVAKPKFKPMAPRYDPKPWSGVDSQSRAAGDY